MNEFYLSQLEWIKKLHEIRSPMMDAFFKFFDFFDRPEFFFILIPAIWIGYHWKMGLRLFYILMISGLVNYGLKHLFAAPRPFHIDPSVAVIYVSGYGFPSGAAQSCVLLSGILLNYFRNKWSYLLAINFVFWVSLSRVYLGVHFPTDILGGWVVGIGLWALFTYVYPAVEKFFESLRLVTLLLISQIIPLFVLYLSRAPSVVRLCSVAMGVGFGLFICSCYKLFLGYPKNTREWIVRATLGVGGTFLIYFATSLLPIQNPTLYSLVRFFILGLWLSMGATLYRIRLKKRH